MSNKRDTLARQNHAAIFNALGDESRLRLISKLTDGPPQSIVQLTEGSGLTRQAVTKHLRVLQAVGLVQSVRAGRENLFELNTEPFAYLQEYLAQISIRWDESLSRLKRFVES